MSTIIKNIITENGEKEFQIRFIDDEKVGVLHSRSGKSFFILDSKEFWYDLIQEKYPQVKKCNCKNNWFTIRFEYFKRNNCNDFSKVLIHLCCTKCKKIKILSVDIDYAPTNELYEIPITFCEQPVLKYKSYKLSGLWNKQGLNEFFDFMCNKLKLNTICWYWAENGKRLIKYLNFEELIKITNEKISFLELYFCKHKISLSEIIRCEGLDGKGVYLKEEPWRYHELIMLKAPIAVVGRGNLYTINACKEYIENGKVIDKTNEFKEIIDMMMNFLSKNYNSARGKHCYDV